MNHDIGILMRRGKMNELKRIELAHLPTPVQKLEKLTDFIRKKNENSPEIYIKRDDFTGIEVSGNKIRKLEYSLAQAKEQGCDLLMTCGGLQSNHCRATAAIGAKLGFKVVVLLRGHEDDLKVGNYLMDELFGADVHLIQSEKNLEAFFPEYIKLYEEKGYKPYLIPTGASNGIGTFGYVNAMKEILNINKENDFDAMVVTVGSGGTYAGLLLGKGIYGYEGDVVGFNIASDGLYFKKRVTEILKEAKAYLNEDIELPETWLKIIDGYQGRGYALNETEDFEFIKEIGALEGLLLDPVYTGKAMKGFVKECEKGTFDHCKKILFVHTGGIFGLLGKANAF